MTDSKLDSKISARLTAKLSRIYYSPCGYWKGLAAIKNLSDMAKVSEDVARAWLNKQAIWQIYLSAPLRVPRPKFDVSVPNEVHLADLLCLPHDRLPHSRKTYKYALTVVDVASRYKEAEPLATKEAKEVADALSRMHKRSPLSWLKLLQVDPGRELMGAVSQLLAKHGVSVRRSRVNIHRDQEIVERFNRTLAERLFGHKYAQEMLLAPVKILQIPAPSDVRSSERVARMPAVIEALNGEATGLTGRKPKNAIRANTVVQKPSSSIPGFQGAKGPLWCWRSVPLPAR
jgi:hypothetical protein